MCTSLFFSADAFDNELIMQTLRLILQGKTVQIPVYDFVTHSRWATTSSLFVFYSVWSVNIGTPSLQVHAVINRIQTLCVIAGKPSLSQCIRPMWSCSRASSCSTLRTSETCFRWSSLLIQIQTHGFRAEVCSASLTSTTMSVTLVKMFTAQPVNDDCEYHLIHKKPMRTTVLDGQYEMLGANYLQILWL